MIGLRQLQQVLGGLKEPQANHSDNQGAMQVAQVANPIQCGGCGIGAIRKSVVGVRYCQSADVKNF